MKRPKGAFGVEWGDDAGEAAARLGVVCLSREPWNSAGAFEICEDMDHPLRAFGGEAFVQLFIRGNKIEGLQLTFNSCDERWDSLRDEVRREFDLSSQSTTDIYDSWSSGELIRLVREGKSCTLTIAGPDFGKAYEAQALAGGIDKLASGLQP